MSLFSRRRVPDSVRAVVLEAGERRLAWALTEGGEPVVATDLGLRVPVEPRLDWPDVERAVWQRPRLTVLGMHERQGAGRSVTVALADEGNLPDVVRTRVSASVAWSSHTRLHPAGGVRVVGRRRPGHDDLEWQLSFDEGTDLLDPGVRLQAERLLEGARRTIG
jgi:hypothetical protein